VSRFVPGHTVRGGRPAGVRTKLNTSFLEDLLAEWREHGRGALRIMRVEEPAAFARLVASTLPKEFTIENVMTDITDEQLDDVIVRLKEQMLTAREPKLIEAKVAKEKVKV
jgi:transcriptional regulator CtsR